MIISIELSDRSKPISDDRLAALEELSALDQELELKHGITGNPMIKARQCTPPQGSVQDEGSFCVSRNAKEPVAWAVAGDNGDYAVKLCFDKASAQTEADRRGVVGLRPDYVVVPLYRHPQTTLTDAEREAVGVALQCVESARCQKHPEELAAAVTLIRVDATLRKLLGRLGGVR